MKTKYTSFPCSAWERTAAMLCVVLALLFTAAVLAPPASVAQEGRSLDDELLDDLGGDPLDDFDPLKPEGDQPPTKPGEDLPPELLERLQRELGEAAADENPMLTIARRMREVERLIAQNDSDKDTQDIQDKIIKDLDELIKQAKKSCKKGGGGASGQKQAPRPRRSPGQPKPKPGGGQKPSKNPASESSQRPQGDGKAEKVDMDQMRAVIKKLWGELPPNQREQMLQLPIEEFLPKYQLMIEEYFRRLSEEKGP